MVPAFVALLPFAFGPPITVNLSPCQPTKTEFLRWSPKGAKVALTADGAGLHGTFELGREPATKVALRLVKSKDSTHFDSLEIDADGDGKFGTDEKSTATPKESKHKWWSNFSSSLKLSVPDDSGGATRTRPYPIDLWFVEDPQEKDSEPVLRWSRRGWHEGECTIDGKPAYVLITDMEMDGVFDQRDVWTIAREKKDLYGTDSRALDGHAWLGDIAYRPTAIDLHGRFLSFESFDPGITRDEESKKADTLAPDREAPRADKPVAFEHDYAAAIARGKSENKRVFVDFETTWCGPCKTMDKLVYTSKAVADAASSIVAVKVDGDEHRDLVKQYGVSAYPTLIVLDATGKETRRAVGYRSIIEVVELLKP